jgi:hypothetical protein
MSNDLNYREKIIHGALDAVVAGGALPGEEGGMVDFPAAVDALLAAIATLAVQSGNYPNPRGARLFAESCGKGLHQMMREIATQDVAWTMDPARPSN